MKINWGQGIAIFMVLFMAFILSFVYKAFTMDSYDHHLVSEEYYKDEINYQQEIDALSNAEKLTENIVVKNTKNGIIITFPKEFNTIKGTIDFQRPSNPKLDIHLPIKLIDNTVLIPKDKLVGGLYNIKIDWKANNVTYLFKEKYFY